MFPSVVPPRTVLRKCVTLAGCICALASPRSVWASINIDYAAVPGTCRPEYGGAVLAFDNTGLDNAGTVTAWGWLVVGHSGYMGGKTSCSAFSPHAGETWITYACESGCDACLAQGVETHLGINLDQSYMGLISSFVYNNNTDTGQPCRATNLDVMDCGVFTCDATPASRSVTTAQEPARYECLSGTGWHVHDRGKTLTVINGSTLCPCPAPIFVGRIRFEYYTSMQPLSTLNRFSRRAPFRVDTLPGGVAACGETLTFTHPPPQGSHFVVVNAIADEVPTLDSPKAVQVWIQEPVLHDGEHLVTGSAEPHGTIDPRGPVILANGGSQAFTITPDAGYRIADVLVDGVSVGAVTRYTLSGVTADHTVLARFALLNSVPDCRRVTAVPSELWPPNHRLVPVRLAGVTDADGDPVMVRIVRITQDEPNGQGSAGPSATIDSTGGVQLRAERAGNGNGRVYTIWYTADDGRGGTCDGSVQVCVPHDRRHDTCADDGLLIDALRTRAAPKRGPGRGHNGSYDSKLELTATSIAGDEATVEYWVPATSIVELAVYDIAGRRVAMVEHARMEEGTHKAVWNVGALPRGVYFYRLQSGSEEVSKTLLLLR